MYNRVLTDLEYQVDNLNSKIGCLKERLRRVTYNFDKHQQELNETRDYIISFKEDYDSRLDAAFKRIIELEAKKEKPKRVSKKKVNSEPRRRNTDKTK